MHLQTFRQEILNVNHEIIVTFPTMPSIFETFDVPKKPTLLLKSIVVLSALCITLYLYAWVQSTPPADFTGEALLEVTSGMSVRDIAAQAENQGIIRSRVFLYAILTYSYDPTKIYAGTYLFSQPASVFEVAKKLADQDIEKKLTRVTLPEGITASTIATIASDALPDFNTQEYLSLTHNLEGYLFPETYFVPQTYTAEDFLALQRKTYEEALAPLRPEIDAHPLSEYEILILASIVEREANDENSMNMVSGILQNRLDIGMALQADASLEYILNKPLSELTAEDLKIDSPYNTYRNKGLVPTPIGNPGIMAIKAVLHPTPSENYYYITDPKGNFHYAETFVAHNKNIEKYLK